MPPSHHSSSSHRSSSSRSFSSSRSSSRSSSSHSSFGSSRSSYRSSRSSSPSSHSDTSHSSMYSSPNTRNIHYGAQYYGGKSGSLTDEKALPRVRVKQPVIKDSSTLLLGRKHDYYYLDSAYQDGDTVYQPGYYDENGDYYAGIAISDKETYCRCEYCGTIHKISGIESAALTCEKCGAPLTIGIIDEIRTNNTGIDNLQYEEDDNDYDRTSAASSKPNRIIAGVVAFVLIVLASGALFTVLRPMFHRQDRNVDQIISQQVVTQPAAESIFVQPIGRRCFMDSEGNYYDQTTDCYFWFNTDINPPQWQYWYEDISNNYGNYGWMEYDDAEGKWYIEKSAGNWVELPEKYLSERLWHFDSAFEYPLSSSQTYQAEGQIVLK